MKFSVITKFFRSTTVRLASTYLLIIMLMSIGFSLVFYHASSEELERQLPPDYAYHYDQEDEDKPPIFA